MSKLTPAKENEKNKSQGNNLHKIRFAVYSKTDGQSGQSLYGALETSIRDLELNVNKEQPLINEKSKMKLGSTIIFEDLQIINQPSFVEYLKSGWFINLSVAIDFTASNGTRHNVQAGGPINDYELALLQVGKILEPYAYKKKFAGFGFGGIPKYQSQQHVSHCFNLNGGTDPTIDGLENVLQ